MSNGYYEKLSQGVSTFTLYSIGVVLIRRRRHDTFLEALNELLGTGGLRLIRLTVSDMKAVADASRNFNLDFDDAYQYAAAEKRRLVVLSFDGDFDRTPRGRKTPTEILSS